MKEISILTRSHRTLHLMRRLSLCIFVVLPAGMAAQSHVINPLASIIDVQERHNELKHAKNSRVLAAVAALPSCLKLEAVPPPPAPMNIPAHYLNGSHGAVNPKEVEATRIYYAFEARVAAGMNQWVANNNYAEAECAQNQIDSWAKAGELLDYDPKVSPQAWYQAGWTLGSIAISESALTNDRKLDKAQAARIRQWMNKSAHTLIDFDKASKQRNNLHYWRGLAATAVGILSSDDELFSYGVSTFKEAVNEIDQRGALPQEMKRHERAIHYQSFALQPLIAIAALSESQNVFLYSYTSLEGRSIHDAIVFLGDAMANPLIVKAYIADTQATDFDAPDFLAAEEYYLHRFSTYPLPKTIREGLKKPTHATRIGGDTTVLAGLTK